MKNKRIIILEGNKDVQNLNLSHDVLPEGKIFSFDFKSHKSLEKLKIPHNLVEDFFTDSDEKLIDGKTMDFVLNWYKEIDLKKLLYVKGISMGNLVEIEIPNYFFLALKRTLGIIKVYEKEDPTEIICGSLSNFVRSLINNKKTTIREFKSDSSSSLYFDSIEIPLSLGTKTKSLKISRKNYLKMKNLVEKITGLIYDIDFDKNLSDKKSVLLLDFNPVQYPDLLNELNSTGQQVILLNQRRPAVWNRESLKIVKNSKCKIVKLEQFRNRRIESEIDILKKEFWKKFDSVFANESKLMEYFSLNKRSFWNAIKTEFLVLLRKRFEELITRTVLVSVLLNNINVGCILDWAHTGTEEKVVLFFANRKKIPIISLQHAVYPLNEKWDKYHSIYPHLPTDEIREAVWGNIIKDYIKKHGMKEGQIILSGSPRHDPFFNRRKKIKTKGTVLIAANIFAFFNLAGNDTRAYERLEKFIKKIIEIIKMYKEKKIIVKLHPTHGYHDVKSLILDIDRSIPIYKNQNLLELLDQCDEVISLNYSTILVDAMILNKPTLVVLAERQGFEQEQIVMKNSTMVVVDLKDIDSNLQKFITNDNVRSNLIKKGSEFVNEYFVNQGNASKYLSQVIKRLMD